MVAVVALVLPLVAPLMRLLLRRRPSLVCYLLRPYFAISHMLTTTTEKEESDEDMGFGLFD